MPQQGNGRLLVADTALPALALLKPALELVEIPGVGLIAEVLSVIMERVEVLIRALSAHWFGSLTVFIPWPMQQVRINKRDRKAFEAQVAALGTVIKNLLTNTNEKLTHEVVHDGIKMDKAIDTIAHSKELVQSLEELLGFGGFIERFTRVSQDAEIIADMGRELREAVDRFKIRAGAAIDKGVQDIKHRVEEDEDRGVLQTLCLVYAGYRSVSEPKSQLMEGTRERLLEKMYKWSTGRISSDDGSPKRIYFLSGRAGVGKSAAVFKFCERLDANAEDEGAPRLGASVFFDRGRGQMTARSLSYALAQQLANTQPVLRPYIVAAARKHLERGQSQLTQFLFQDLLSTPLSQSSKRIPEGLRVVLVIDGLDECPDQEVLQECFNSLFQLIAQFSWLYLLAASRPSESETPVAGMLKSDTAAVYYHDLNVDGDAERDVRKFLEAKVPMEPKYALFVKEHPDRLRNLVARASGLFIFARIALNLLHSRDYCDDPEQGFRIVLLRETGLDKMDALYLSILKARFPPDVLHQSPHRHALLLSFLHTIALVGEDVTLNVTAIFADPFYDCPFIQKRLRRETRKENALTVDDLFLIYTRLASILYIDTSRHELLPTHISFYEFLVSPERCSDIHYRVDKGEGYAVLFSTSCSLFTLDGVKLYLQLHSRHSKLGVVTDSDKEARGVAIQQVLFRGDVYNVHAARTEEFMSTLRRNAAFELFVPCFARIFARAGRDNRWFQYNLLMAFDLTWLVRVWIVVGTASLLSTHIVADTPKTPLGEAFGTPMYNLTLYPIYCGRYLAEMLLHPDWSQEQINVKVRDDCKTMDDYAVGSGHWPSLWHKLKWTNTGTEEEQLRRLSEYLRRFEERWKVIWDALEEDPELKTLWYGLAGLRHKGDRHGQCCARRRR
ncbi:hypothetical protein BN946_scf184594.g6 [Trametes cinnabarina]|uniref:Nephrocystin 3-like N-terminal domain-containing protein n=1 Tax=Pycnoporus cinnabarinus TaxID=5643 RepID=A0A060SXE8_PYCCI|nr:hypothetical protein BN946_scf184594.g6 [Trametes cinnabarina]